MDHAEMVTLLRAGVPASGGVWADLGAGAGNFTRALAELLGPAGTVYALDHDRKAIAAQEARPAASSAARILPKLADVTQPLALPPLDGILLANLLHFIRDQEGLLHRLAGDLRPGGRLLIVEYDRTFPMPWVPHPVPFARFAALARAAGLADPAQIGSRRSPSSGQAMYSALALLPAGIE